MATASAGEWVFLAVMLLVASSAALASEPEQEASESSLGKAIQVNFKIRFRPGSDSSNSQGCIYWCRTPWGSYYCCRGEDATTTTTPRPPRRVCPPVRPVCPGTRAFRPPQRCSSDWDCPSRRPRELCCYDICLEHHTCKPSVRRNRNRNRN